MAWIDITRNIKNSTDTFDTESYIIDLFTFNDVLYTIVRDGTSLTPPQYKIYGHLGADPPVVDIIWGTPMSFYPMPSSQLYVPGGKAEDTSAGLIYIGNNTTGEVYVNINSGVIDGQWSSISGPYGADEFSATNANLRTLTIHNNKLYAGHAGGVAVFDAVTTRWDIAGVFYNGPRAQGAVTSLYSFRNSLYAAVSFENSNVLYRYDASVTLIDKWIKVAEFPEDITGIMNINEYRGKLFVIVQDINKNIFSTDGIDDALTGAPRFIDGVHLSGVPTSIFKYRQDNSLWVTCARTAPFIPGKSASLGDVNGDGVVDYDDLNQLIDFIYLSKKPLMFIDAGDMSQNGATRLQDIAILIAVLNGSIDPRDELTLDTMGPNEITQIRVPPREDISMAVFDADKFLRPEGPGDEGSGRFFPDAGAFVPFGTNITIVFPEQVAPLSHLALYSPKALQVIDNLAIVLSSPIRDFSKEHTVTCELEIIDPLGAREQDSSERDHTTRMSISMGLSDPNDLTGRKFLHWGNSGFNIDKPVSIHLPGKIPLGKPTLEGIQYYQNAPYKWYFSYTFDARNLRNIPTGEMRIKFVIYLTNVGDLVNNFDNVHYRPTLKIKDLTINSSGNNVFVDTDYIVKNFGEIPTDDKAFHDVEIPSGPDQWFVKFSEIRNNQGILIAPLEVPNFFDGVVIRKLVTNGVSLEVGEDYIMSFIVYVPAEISNPINIKAYSPQLNDGRYIFNHSITNVFPGSIQPYTVNFTVPVDIGADILSEVPFYLEAWEDIPSPASSTISTSLDTPSIYFSDISITEKITGTPVNTIYRYNGVSWNNTTTQVVDPVPYQNIPRYGLIDNWDSTSNAYQLYSVGGGRVWVWNLGFPEGLYSGSALGIEFDRRPQIISML